MKILLIGIDGGDERIMRALPMPFLQSLLDQSADLNLREDLWGRGWVKMLSGLPAFETGAFYSKPLFNGGVDFTQRFKSVDLTSNPKVTPLWKLIEDRGGTVGFMNVPSTNPAPVLKKGFFISGAGGGMSLKGVGALPEGAAEPENARCAMQRAGYVFDVRFMASGIRDLDEYFGALTAMTEKRTQVFLNLAGQYRVSFGFPAYMGLNRVQNIAMSELQTLIDNGCCPKNRIQDRILRFYTHFDDNMKRLLEGTAPEHYIIASDHGQELYKTRINVNAWLEEAGLLKAQVREPYSRRALNRNRIKNALSAAIPNSIRYCVFKGKLEPIEFPILKEILKTKTKLFGARYLPGIYLNDERFGGVVPNADAQELKHRVVEAFNTDERCKKSGLHARRYRENYLCAGYERLLPDIWIDSPDTAFFVQQGDFLTANPALDKPIESLWQVNRDMYTGIKGSRPLARCDIGLSGFRGGLPEDLTAVYHLVKKVFS